MKHHPLPQITVRIARAPGEWEGRLRAVDGRRLVRGQRFRDRLRRDREPLALIAAGAELAPAIALALVVIRDRVGVGDKWRAALVLDPDAFARKREQRIRRRARVEKMRMIGGTPPPADADQRRRKHHDVDVMPRAAGVDDHFVFARRV